MEIVIYKETEKYINKSKSWADDTDIMQTHKHLSFMEIVQEIIETVNKLTVEHVEVVDTTVLMSLICVVNDLIKLYNSLKELPEKITTFVINNHCNELLDGRMVSILEKLHGTIKSEEKLIDNNEFQLDEIFSLLNEELRKFLIERIEEELSKLITELQNLQELIKRNAKELMMWPNLTNNGIQRLQVSFYRRIALSV